jgi:tetratricopeptide (TPR) repeat protein
MNAYLIRCLISILSIGTVLTPSVSWAQAGSFEELSADDKQRLAALIDAAKRDYDVGNFESSLESFQRGYDIYPHPDILYRMGLCYERLGEDAAAVRLYREFLEKVPNAPERPRIEKTITIIESRISRSEIRISTDPEGAVVYIDDRANGVAGYTPTALPVKPGNYRIVVEKEGFESIEELVSVESGQTLQLRYQLNVGKAVAKKVDETPSNPNTPKVVALIAVGAASGIASAIFFNGYSGASSELDILDRKKTADKDSVSRQEYDDAQSSMYTNLTLGIVTAGVTVGALVWAYILWNDQPTQVATPIMGWQDGPQVGMQWTW